MREIIRKDPNEYWTNVLFQERKCNSIFIAFHGYNLSRGQFSCIHFDCRLVWWFIMANSELWRLTHLFRRLFVWVCVYVHIDQLNVQISNYVWLHAFKSTKRQSICSAWSEQFQAFVFDRFNTIATVLFTDTENVSRARAGIYTQKKTNSALNLNNFSLIRCLSAGHIDRSYPMISQCINNFRAHTIIACMYKCN